MDTHHDLKTDFAKIIHPSIALPLASVVTIEESILNGFPSSGRDEIPYSNELDIIVGNFRGWHADSVALFQVQIRFGVFLHSCPRSLVG